jgi:hypothetical protein
MIRQQGATCVRKYGTLRVSPCVVLRARNQTLAHILQRTSKCALGPFEINDEVPAAPHMSRRAANICFILFGLAGTMMLLRSDFDHYWGRTLPEENGLHSVTCTAKASPLNIVRQYHQFPRNLDTIYKARQTSTKSMPVDEQKELLSAE